MPFPQKYTIYRMRGGLYRGSGKTRTCDPAPARTSGSTAVWLCGAMGSQVIDLVGAAQKLSIERRAHLMNLLNGGLFLCHTSADAAFIARHIAPAASAQFYGAFFFQNRSFPMSDEYERIVGQALLSCRVFLVAVSASSLCSQYMRAEINVASVRKMPMIVCCLDKTDPRELSPLLTKTPKQRSRSMIAFVDFSLNATRGERRLQTTLTRRSFRCTHSLTAQLPA